jgi:hypothetical protein
MDSILSRSSQRKRSTFLHLKYSGSISTDSLMAEDRRSSRWHICHDTTLFSSAIRMAEWRYITSDSEVVMLQKSETYSSCFVIFICLVFATGGDQLETTVRVHPSQNSLKRWNPTHKKWKFLKTTRKEVEERKFAVLTGELKVLDDCTNLHGAYMNAANETMR